MRRLLPPLSGLIVFALAGHAAALTPLRSREQQAEDAVRRARAAAIIASQARACFNVPPQGRVSAVRVAFRLNPDGSLAGPPKTTPAPTASVEIAAAARRAVIRCAPYVMPADLRASPYLWTSQSLRFTTQR